MQDAGAHKMRVSPVFKGEQKVRINSKAYIFLEGWLGTIKVMMGGWIETTCVCIGRRLTPLFGVGRR